MVHVGTNDAPYEDVSAILNEIVESINFEQYQH